MHYGCRAVAVALSAPTRAHPVASPRTPCTGRLWTSGARARYICASHGFLCALCAAGALHWSDCLAYDLSFALAHTLLCAAWLFLQRRLCAHLPHWRVLYWRLCSECFVLPCDGMHCCWLEHAATMLLECEHAGWQRYFHICRWSWQPRFLFSDWRRGSECSWDCFCRRQCQ